MEENYDLLLERMYHPENFEPFFDDDEDDGFDDPDEEYREW